MIAQHYFNYIDSDEDFILVHLALPKEVIDKQRYVAMPLKVKCGKDIRDYRAGDTLRLMKTGFVPYYRITNWMILN